MYELPGAVAEREAIEATNPVPDIESGETLKALLSEASSPSCGKRREGRGYRTCRSARSTGGSRSWAKTPHPKPQLRKTEASCDQTDSTLERAAALPYLLVAL